MTVSEKLRLVRGLHSHAEMFGFNWNDDSDWTWHDVACKIADEIDAENEKLREELAKWERLTAGINLPDYPVSQFVPKYIERENAELRELVKECHELLQDLLAGWALQPLTVKVMEQRMRELGIEVDA